MISPPQMACKNPTQAEHDFVGSISEYASSSVVDAIWTSIDSSAKAGGSTVLTGKNPFDPNVTIIADLKVTPIGVKTVPAFPDLLQAVPFHKASVAVRGNDQMCGVDAKGVKLHAQNGETGNFAWTDTMHKTASGQGQMISKGPAKAVPSCSS